MATVRLERPDGTWEQKDVTFEPRALEGELTRLWKADPVLPAKTPAVWDVALYAREPVEEWENLESIALAGITDCDGAARWERSRLAGLGLPSKPWVYPTGRPGKYHVVLRTPRGVHDPTFWMERATSPKQVLAHSVLGHMSFEDLGFSWGDIWGGAKRAWKGTRKLARTAGKALLKLTPAAKQVLAQQLAAQLGPLAPVILPQVEKAVAEALKRQ